jgi:tetratricopeptide (TPR) repeat protein
VKTFPKNLLLAAPLAGLALLAGCSAEKKMSPADQIADGWKQYHVGEFDIGVRDFKTVADAQPAGSDFRIQGLYGEASIWNDRRDARDPDHAVALYHQILKEAPNHALAPWVSLDLVRVQHLAPAEQPLDWNKLAQEYGDVYRKYPASPAGEQAFMYRVNILINVAPKKQLPGVLKDMQDFLQAHPKSIYIGSLYGFMVGCCDRLGQEPERLDYMIKALGDTSAPQTGTDPTTSYAASYWAIAYAAEFEVGDFPVAREYYQRLLKEYPTDVRVFAARKALVRMDAVEAALRAGQPLPRELAGGVAQ